MEAVNLSVYSTRQTVFSLSSNNERIAVIQQQLFAPPTGSRVTLLYNSQQQLFTVEEVEIVLNPSGESIRVLIKVIPFVFDDRK
jgi:hypothetical protein